MKLWLKYVIGLCIGIILGIYLPFDNQKIVSSFAFLAELFIRIGIYVFIPIIFFSVASGIGELREERQVFSVFGRSFIYMVFSFLILTVFGVLTVVFFSPQRVPIIREELIELPVLSFKEIMFKIFPETLFSIFSDGLYAILPVFLLAIIIGLNFHFDRVVTRPVQQFFDSMNRILYQINILITEIFGIGMIILGVYFILQLRSSEELFLFREHLILLIIDTVVIILGLYPLILFLKDRKSNPYKQIYAVLAPLLGVFFSGHTFLGTSLCIRHVKKNLGIPRKIGSITMPFFALFGKAGTSMVTVIGFVIILRSYSSLGIGFMDILWIIFFGIIVSFVTFSIPGSAVIVTLGLLCKIFGNGLQEGYILLKPVFVLLVNFSVFLDLLTGVLSSYLVAKDLKQVEEINSNDFI